MKQEHIELINSLPIHLQQNIKESLLNNFQDRLIELVYNPINLLFYTDEEWQKLINYSDDDIEIVFQQKLFPMLKDQKMKNAFKLLELVEMILCLKK